MNHVLVARNSGIKTIVFKNSQFLFCAIEMIISIFATKK